MPLFFFALLAGIVTVAGPCILPLLPVILGTASVQSHRARPLFIVLGFILAFCGVVLIFAVFGQAIPFSSQAFRTVAAIIIGLFGLSMLFPQIQEKLFGKMTSAISRLAPQQKADGGLLSGFILGASLGLVWTPCAGPVLGSILTLVASRHDLSQAAGLLLAYAIGAAVPMLAIAYGGQAAITRVHSLAKYTTLIQRCFGVLIILVAIGLYFGFDQTIQTYLLTNDPWLFPNRLVNL